MNAIEYCFLWINWWPLCMTKAEWSGWVQAIGSILAIAGSVLAVGWANRLQLEATRTDRRNAHAAAVENLSQRLSMLIAWFTRCADLWESGGVVDEELMVRSRMAYAVVRDADHRDFLDPFHEQQWLVAKLASEAAWNQIEHVWGSVKYGQIQTPGNYTPLIRHSLDSMHATVNSLYLYMLGFK